MYPKADLRTTLPRFTLFMVYDPGQYKRIETIQGAFIDA